MTIALGFLCQDGIVLGADTQLTATGSHKRYACKLFRHNSSLAPWAWSSMVTYSGYPACADSFNNRFRDEMREAEGKWPITAEIVRDVIIGILRSFDPTDSESTEFLCGVALPNTEHRLYRTKGTLVSEVRDNAYIGVGDSSVIGYLLPLITRYSASGTQQAALIATYLIRAAKMYIDGCGGDTDIWILMPSGNHVLCSGNTFAAEEHLAMLEFFFSDVASSLILDVTESEFEERIDRMCRRLRNERTELRRFFRPLTPTNLLSTTTDPSRKPPSQE